MSTGVTVKVTSGDVKRRFVAQSYGKLQETAKKLFGEGSVLTTQDGELFSKKVFSAAKDEGRLLDVIAVKGDGIAACVPISRPRPVAKDYKAAAQAERLRWMREQLGDLEEEEPRQKPATRATRSEAWDSDDSDNSEEEVECILKLKTYQHRATVKPLATVSQRKARMLDKVHSRFSSTTISAVTAALTAAAVGIEREREEEDEEEDEEEEEEEEEDTDTDTDSASDSSSDSESDDDEEDEIAAKGSETLTIPLRSAASSSSKDTTRRGRAPAPYEDDPLVEWLLSENERLSHQVALLQQERCRPSRASSQPPHPSQWETHVPRAEHDNPYDAYTAAYFD